MIIEIILALNFNTLNQKYIWVNLKVFYKSKKKMKTFSEIEKWTKQKCPKSKF